MSILRKARIRHFSSYPGGLCGLEIRPGRFRKWGMRPQGGDLPQGDIALKKQRDMIPKKYSIPYMDTAEHRFVPVRRETRPPARFRPVGQPQTIRFRTPGGPGPERDVAFSTIARRDGLSPAGRHSLTLSPAQGKVYWRALLSSPAPRRRRPEVGVGSRSRAFRAQTFRAQTPAGITSEGVTIRCL